MTTALPKIILDTDPGGDDIFALLWLLSLVRQGLADLLAITTTGGNVATARTFASASQVLDLVGFRAIEVGRGVELPTDDRADASHIHGSDGMGNLSASLPPASQQFDRTRFSDDLLIDRLQAHPGEITLVAIGPLTNLAAAEAKSPGVLQLAREIVVMGGALFTPGNVAPQGEFNIWFNPPAAATVFQSRGDIVLLPLDVTRQLIFTPAMAQTICQPQPESRLAQFLSNLTDFMVSTALSYRETLGQPGFLVHDAATLGYLFYPELFWFQRAQVRVETQGWNAGQTTIDRRPLAKTGANAWVALGVEKNLFFTHLVQDLQYLMGHL